MRRLTMAAVAGWPILAFDPNSAAAPPDYLDQQRCLAIFNIAIAVPTPEDPEETSPLMLKRMVVTQAYDRLEHMVASRPGLTAEQEEAGAGTFENEQRGWLDRYGQAPTREAQDVVVVDLAKEVDLCLPLPPK